ncbi:hypothetical protein SCG7086_AH_00190 [Chlamydiales bacterium SCGC AG-110-P3]|nr:hypothetical protein SCG7086_AH_00190 [Chlamydiales bacterium SCGC AG-110-P3]
MGFEQLSSFLELKKAPLPLDFSAWFRKQYFWVTALTDKRDPAPV